ncbi:aminopeptidase P family N-terminal domain-containing protein [Komagataeibacter rhaeticus]|nr:aminopeptidase P family N-terminal domain-containing protein [Komagataeibacter rhaeticus]
MAAILPDRAAVFSDGRYITQMDQQVDAGVWERLHIRETPPPAWLAAHGASLRIGYDPRLIGESALRPFSDAGLTLVALPANPVDRIWTDRPAAPCTPCVPQPEDLAGQSSHDKRATLAASLRGAGDSALVLSDPASIAWLLNIRGQDVPYTPLSLSFAIVHDTGHVTLLIDPAKLSGPTRAWLGPDVTLLPPMRWKRPCVPWRPRACRWTRPATPSGSSRHWWMRGPPSSARENPCVLPKAIKNPTEQEGSRHAHLLDGVAICRFLHWLEENATRTTELEAADRLDRFRAASPDYRGELSRHFGCRAKWRGHPLPCHT